MSNNKLISVFPNVTSKTTDSLSLEDIISRIRSREFESQILAIREAIEDGKNEQAGSLKRKLPAFTPSGTFQGGHAASDLTEYSGILHIDVDKIDPKRLSSLAQELRQTPDVLAFFLSPSGKGLKIFYRSDGSELQHKSNMVKLMAIFKQRYGFDPDFACKDLPRLCYFSHDPDAFFNPDAEPVKLDTDQSVFAPLEDEVVKETGLRFMKGERNKFLFQLAIRCKRKQIPLQLTLNFTSTKYAQSDFPEVEIQTTVTSAYKGEYGINKTPAAHSAYDKISETLAKLGYKFKRNVVKNNVDCLINGHWRELNDTLINDLLIAVNQITKATETQIRSVIYSSQSPDYDPFELYILELEPWDGHDHIGELWATLGLGPELQFGLEKWLMLMVKSMLNPAITNPYCLTLIGPQGIGKSQWLQRLIPVKIAEYKSQMIVDPKDKDTKISLAENLLIIVDELDALSKAEAARLKEMITSPGYKIRAPYGKLQEHRKRRASFCASLNNPQFLFDKSGARRFLCLEIPGLIHYAHNIDMDQVFAQAYALAKEVESAYFTRDEEELFSNNNLAFQAPCLEEEAIRRFCKPPAENEDYQSLTASEIAQKLKERDERIEVTHQTLVDIGMILTRRGFRYTRSQGCRRYRIVFLEKDEQSEV
ncbi:MAG: VapE domain-containing protein [Bacteroidota bacterium]|jgi:hypothetical protein